MTSAFAKWENVFICYNKMNIYDWNFAQFQITLFKRVLEKSTLAI